MEIFSVIHQPKMYFTNPESENKCALFKNEWPKEILYHGDKNCRLTLSVRFAPKASIFRKFLCICVN